MAFRIGRGGEPLALTLLPRVLIVIHQPLADAVKWVKAGANLCTKACLANEVLMDSNPCFHHLVAVPALFSQVRFETAGMGP